MFNKILESGLLIYLHYSTLRIQNARKRCITVFHRNISRIFRVE